MFVCREKQKCGAASAVAGTNNRLWIGWLSGHCKREGKGLGQRSGRNWGQQASQELVLQCCKFSSSLTLLNWCYFQI